MHIFDRDKLKKQITQPDFGLCHGNVPQTRLDGGKNNNWPITKLCYVTRIKFWFQYLLHNNIKYLILWSEEYARSEVPTRCQRIFAWSFTNSPEWTFHYIHTFGSNTTTALYIQACVTYLSRKHKTLSLSFCSHTDHKPLHQHSILFPSRHSDHIISDWVFSRLVIPRPPWGG